MSRKQSRGFTITCNNYTYGDCAALILLADKYRYVCCGFEVAPTTGTPHLQGYVYNDVNIEFNSLKKQLPRFNILKSKGTELQNIGYASKDGDFWESGYPPQQGKVKYNAVKYLMSNPTQNFHLFTQYRKAYAEYQGNIKKKHKRCLYLIQGDDVDFELKKCESNCYSINLYDSDHYDNEDIVFDLYSYRENPWELWKKGYPRKQKRGYVNEYIDPKIVYVVYNKDTHDQCQRDFLGTFDRDISAIDFIEEESEEI